MLPLLPVPTPPSHQQSADKSVGLAHTATAQGSDSIAPGAGPALSKGDGLGRYTILETLGSGGMGVVYGAYDPDLDRKVALKLLRGRQGPQGTATDSDRARLLREARAMAKLSCPNVITVFEVGTVAERDFVAMEFIDGGTLADWIKQPRQWPEVVEIFRMAGAGLASAHDAGLIHRDFKPANVLIRSDGRVVVTDFGLARLTDEAVDVASGGGTGELSDSANSEQLTRTGAVLGTPAYVSPEQYNHQPADEQSDQFGFCVALYEALYGERPFKGATFDELRAATLAAEIPPEPRGSSVPSWLRALVLRGLSFDAKDRYPGMAELLRALSSDPSTRRRWLVAGAATVAILGLVAVYAVSRSESNHDEFERGKRAAQAQQCTDDERTFAGIWDGEKKKLLKSAFLKASADAATATYDGFVRVIDGYKQDWSRIYKTACEATRVEHKRSEEDFHLHMGCLLQRRNQLKSLVEVFLRADARVAGRAVQAAQSLPRVTDCSDLKLLRSGLTPAKDPKTRDAVAKVRRLLAEARALQQALRLKQGVALAAKAVVMAKESGYRPVEAEALYRLGALYFLFEKTSEARRTLKEAAFVAALSEHVEYQARIAVTQIQLEAKFSSRNAATRRQAELAASILKRYGRDETLQAHLDSALGRLAIDDGNYDDAEERFDRAYKTLRRVLGANNLRTVSSLQRLAEVAQLKGKLGHALALHQSAQALLQRQLGPDHPRVISAVESVALRMRMTGRYDESRRLFAQAKRYWDSPAGERAMVAFGLPKRVIKQPRVVSGLVVDLSGKPVADADVVMGEMLSGDAKYLYAAHPRSYEQVMNNHNTRTDSAGRFSFPHADGTPMYIAAESPAGRSAPILLTTKGPLSKVQIRLRGFGQLEGTVTVSGKRPPELRVFTVASGDMTKQRAGFGAMVLADGSFKYVRMAEGEYLLVAEVGGDVQGRIYSARKLVVRAGETTHVDFEIKTRGADVAVVVAGDAKQDVGTLQLALFEGRVMARTLDQVRKVFRNSTQRSKARVGNTKRVAHSNSQHFTFRGMAKGNYTVCSVVLGGDLKDPQFSRTLKHGQPDIKVQCDPLTVTAKSKTQQKTITLAGDRLPSGTSRNDK